MVGHHFEVVEYLLKQSADVDQGDKFRSTALDMAQETMGNSETKDKIIAYLKSKMRRNPEQSIVVQTSQSSRKRSIENPSTSKEPDHSSPSSAKVRKTMVDSSTSTDEVTNQETVIQEQSMSLEEIATLVQPLKESLIDKDNFFTNKMICLSAIDAILSRDRNVCIHIAKKVVINEIASIVREIVPTIEHGQIKDFEVIARILAKLNQTGEGKKLICDMNLSFGAFEKLKAEMRKYELNLDHNQFMFDSESKSIKKES